MNWSSTFADVSIPIEAHNICAETLVKVYILLHFLIFKYFSLKAHFVHCKQRNILISKPLNKISRLATKCPDLEQMFDRFCWDILIKLKISENVNFTSLL